MSLRFLNIILFLVVIDSIYSVDQDYLNKYKHHTVYQVFTETDKDVEFLSVIEKKIGTNFDYWNEANNMNKWTHLMLKSEFKTLFEDIMKSLNLNFSVLIENVGNLIENQLILNSKTNMVSNDFDYGKYHTLDEISKWMNDTQAAYPKFVSVFNVSRSYEGRTINVLKISVPSSSKKPAIWFDGGIHAREWISPATVIYMAHMFLSNYSIDPDVTKILDSFDLYVLPVFNPDGYEYTWNKDRLWRKTRSKTKIPGCYGADPNRNWDAHFCEKGASRDPCSDTFCGMSPFSEIEIKGVADFILKNNDSIVSYLNFHSYSQLWMTPWGYTTNKPKDFEIQVNRFLTLKEKKVIRLHHQDNGSAAAVNALIKLYGTRYQHGNIASTIYVASGSSVDWTYDTAKILYSYAVELRDQGQYGFMLPPDQIIPSGLETFEAMKALSFYILKQLK
ncbi:carboxypeptidase A2 [Brachionus plicatilis]|uniref:Carboxypeptidase A2 n=1 Tax=Brachionus plicatilis TaxID=10195 RepID=A0A3M7P2W8_BRAPC|nr:carboxypeptidase A2 [Brachionus plicatilis]